MGTPTSTSMDVLCPHCDHKVPPAVRCARCGMRFRGHRRRFRWLQAAVIFVCIGVLTWIQIVVRNREPPLIQIGNIKPYMNFSAVRIQGRLEADARRLKSGSMVYVVSDGSGTLAVFSSQVPEGSFPRAGDYITVSGSLSVGAGNNIRLQMRSIDRVVIEPSLIECASASDTELSDISTDLKGTRIQVLGRASRLWAPPAGSKAPYRIVLTDRSGSLDVVHWLPEPPDANVGDTLEVDGIVQVYNGQVQLKLLNSEDVRVLE